MRIGNIFFFYGGVGCSAIYFGFEVQSLSLHIFNDKYFQF